MSTSASAPAVRVEIYDQAYNLRGTDAEYIIKLAEFVDSKMRSVAEQTSTVDSLRLAVLAALNIAAAPTCWPVHWTRCWKTRAKQADGLHFVQPL